MGRLRAEQDDLDGAISAYSQAIALAPQDAQALERRGSCLRRKGELTAALADLSRAVELAPRDAWIWDSRGDVRYKQREIEAAIEDYTQAIALDPKAAIFWYDRGRAKLKAGRLDEGIKDLDEAIRLNPRDDLALYRRADARLEKGDQAGALADYTAVIAIDPQDHANFRARGVARNLTGDFTGALADYEQAIALAGEDTVYLRFWCLQLRLRLKRHEPGDTLAALATAAKDDWPRTLARFLSGSLDEAALLAGPLAMNDQTGRERRCEAYYYAGMARLVKDDRTGARLCFERCLATELKTFYEYQFAQAELRRLGQPAGR
jgi:tetratricopeptide (TPR) repeat protein